jgi:hypothetical protein
MSGLSWHINNRTVSASDTEIMVPQEEISWLLITKFQEINHMINYETEACAPNKKCRIKNYKQVIKGMRILKSYCYII